MAKPSPNLLLVEGKDEQYSLPLFMDHYVVWGHTKEDRPVEIEEFSGFENLLKPGVIEAQSKMPGLRAFRIVIDADDFFDTRWLQVRERCRKVAPGFPEELPTGGVQHERTDGLRIGVWIMPDNHSRGMLETFLSFLLKPQGQRLWELATQSCDQASGIDGCYTAAHRDKANVHTYLAWVEPPGKSLQESIRDHVLDAKSPQGQEFARWFMDLFQLAPRDALPT